MSAREPDLIEAHGVRGMRSTRWRRTFRSAEALSAFIERTGAEVHATRVIPGRFTLAVGMVIRLRADIGGPTAGFLLDGQPAGAVATVEAIRPDAHGNPFWATLRFADGTAGGTDTANVIDIHGAYTAWEVAP